MQKTPLTTGLMGPLPPKCSTAMPHGQWLAAESVAQKSPVVTMNTSGGRKEPALPE
jgi:hypothetical protein